MRAYRVATLLGASGLALSALVFGPSFGCGQEPGSACVTDQDCRSHEACANASCVALDCPANRRWVTDSDRGRVCSECRDSTDCAEGQSCVDWDHRSDYGGPRRCLGTNCESDSECRLEEVCLSGLCIPETERCETQADCTSAQSCLRGRCERIRCPKETPFVGQSPTGPFCEQCQADDDCAPNQRCQASPIGEHLEPGTASHECVATR